MTGKVVTLSHPSMTPTLVTIPTSLLGESNFNPFSSPTFYSSASLATPNIINLVTIKLQSIEDYLTWKTQFISLLISHDLLDVLMAFYHLKIELFVILQEISSLIPTTAHGYE